MSNQHRAYILDQPHGGHPPGSDGARMAIQTVGQELFGKDWRPGKHRAAVMERGHQCLGCETIIRAQTLRCHECNRMHLVRIARARAELTRARIADEKRRAA